jgi:glutamine synthetase
LSEDERHRLNIRRLPRTLTEALEALQADTVLMAALGTELAQEYLIVKHAEAAAFRDKDEMFELAHHFYVY